MKFSPTLYFAIAAISGLVPHSFAQNPTPWSGTAVISFAGTSTLHDWSGTVSAQPFQTTVAMIDDHTPGAIKARVEVKVAEMDTKEPKRDENLRKAMQAVKFPLVAGEIDTEFSKLSRTPGAAPAELPLKLSLLGKNHSIKGTISHWKQDGGRVSFEMDFDLSLKACGVRVPPVLLVIRVGDVVKVHATVELKKLNA